MIPYDAIGIYANDNVNPLLFRYSTSNDVVYAITERTDNFIKLQAIEPSESHGNNYLGAIVSKDRSIVYWTNTSKPIP